MTILDLSVVLLAGAVGAGFLGALTGMGGGVILIPFLVLLMGIDIHYAIGTALVSVIATSSGAASAYVREGYSNTRVGMLLEVATTFGAVLGAWLAHYIDDRFIAIIFGCVLIYTAWLTRQAHMGEGKLGEPDRLAAFFRLDASYPGPDGALLPYQVRGVPGGFGLMGVAGILSGLLGIGSGVIKVLAMDRIMRLPFKVSTTTSNFMIGVTAAASTGIYLSRGYIDPVLSMPVMLGVLLGSLVGARFLKGANVAVLRVIFAIIIVLLGIQMIYHGATGKL
jgi:hypothetical protein